jgi:hypothetical protein
MKFSLGGRMKPKNDHRFFRLRWIMTLLAILSFFPVCSPAQAQEPWVGIFFSPQANTNNDHQIFLSDFEAMVKALKAKGVIYVYPFFGTCDLSE